MIELTTMKRFRRSGLILQNDEWIISESLQEPIMISSSMRIRIKKGTKAMLLDTSSHATVSILIEEDASLDYQIVNSKNTNRTISCFGNLNITEICLEETEEACRIDLMKDDVDVHLELLSIANGQKALFVQSMNHLCKHTNSSISNFGVAMDSGSILFDTTGKIEKGKAQSKCVQLSKGIVMDDTSAITSKPILLIDEYDVIANHGASIGKMSDDILFYLMSRGLSKTDAFLLILEGIISPFIEKIKDEKLQNEIRKKLTLLIKR